MTKKIIHSLPTALVVWLFFSSGLSASGFDQDELQRRLKRLSPYQMDEVLWLARCIYSETNRANEQKLVAWTVRNRVESQYRGKTYRDVVLEPLQFSAFNTDSPRRTHILNLDQEDSGPKWLQALEIALNVFQADPIDRPFSARTRHFYSPVSMPNNRAPDWAKFASPLDSKSLGIDPNRFLFFEDIDEAGDPYLANFPTPKTHIDKFQEETRKRLTPTSSKAPLRERLKPSGRVKRPARPRARSTKPISW